MKFEKVQIHFSSDVLVCCHPEILLSWQRDVTTSPLYVVNSSYVQTDATTPNIFGPTMLGVVASVCTWLTVLDVYITTRHYASRPIIVHHYASLSITTHHFIIWYVYWMSQKFVRLISCITNFVFTWNLSKDFYCSIEYSYSDVQ